MKDMDWLPLAEFSFSLSLSLSSFLFSILSFSLMCRLFIVNKEIWPLPLSLWSALCMVKCRSMKIRYLKCWLSIFFLSLFFYLSNTTYTSMNRPPSTPTNQDPKCKPWAQHDEQTRLSSPQTDLNRQTSPQARNNGWGPLTQDPSYKPSGRMQQTSNRSSPRYPPEPTNRNSLAPSSSWQSEDRTRPHPNDTNKQDTAKSNQRWRSSQQSSNDHTRPIPNDTNKQETAKFSQPWEGRLRSDYRPVNEQSQRQNYRPAPRQQQHSPPTSSQAPIRKDVPSKVYMITRTKRHVAFLTDILIVNRLMKTSSWKACRPSQQMTNLTVSHYQIYRLL